MPRSSDPDQFGCIEQPAELVSLIEELGDEPLTTYAQRSFEDYDRSVALHRDDK